jgi:hypothetical protein
VQELLVVTTSEESRRVQQSRMERVLSEL